MKKVLATLLASAMALTAMGGLVACDNDEPKGPTIKVWAPQLSLDGYRPLVSQFKELHPEYKDYQIKFEPKAEDVVQTALGKNPSTGPDLFFFPSDHLYKLYNRSVLQKLPTDLDGTNYAQIVKDRDEQFTYEFATINNEIMAFPATNDNGYFLYYDSTFFDEDDVKSLDTMQEKAKAAGKKISFDFGTAYMAASFYIGTGCTFDFSDHTMKKYDTTLDSPEGEAAIRAYARYFSTAKNNAPASANQVITNSDLVTGFKDGTCVAGITGTWKWSEMKENVPNATTKIKTTVLPEFTDGVSATPYKMGSFYGAKYCGVNALKSTKTIPVALALAEFLTSEVGQLARYNQTSSGPSNIKLCTENEDIKKDPILQTYKAQIESKGYIQHDQSDGFWADTGIVSPVKKLATLTTYSVDDALEELKSIASTIKIDKTK